MNYRGILHTATSIVNWARTETFSRNTSGYTRCIFTYRWLDAKIDVTPLRTRWIYAFFALIHRYFILGRDQPVGLSHRPHLPYTEAFCTEVMRIYPITPLGIPRATSCDVDIRKLLLFIGKWNKQPAFSEIRIATSIPKMYLFLLVMKPHHEEKNFKHTAADTMAPCVVRPTVAMLWRKCL